MFSVLPTEAVRQSRRYRQTWSSHTWLSALAKTKAACKHSALTAEITEAVC